MKKLYFPIIIFVGISGFIFYSYSKKQQAPLKVCGEAYRLQSEAYATDRLADTETFEKYKMPVYAGKLTNLNLKTSSEKAKFFRTWINANMSNGGINFAGHYSIVHVGMTGWGLNYFLIDRITGEGVPIPFQIRYLKTLPDSSLLIINPKDLIYSDIIGDTEFVCGEESTGNYGEYYSDLRPYYYNWDGTKFVPLGNKANINPFWERYF